MSSPCFPWLACRANMLRWITILLLGSLAIGCGGPADGMGAVSGTVTLDGQPLPGVMVTFSPADGSRESYGVTNESGSYQLRYTTQIQGALVGEHEVRVSPMGIEPKQPVPKKTEAEVPSHYYGEDSIKHEVEAGSNTIDLELSSTPPNSTT